MELLINFNWPGNIRQLKNVAEQISVIESTREVSETTLKKYLPENINGNNLPMVINDSKKEQRLSQI